MGHCAKIFERSPTGEKPVKCEMLPAIRDGSLSLFALGANEIVIKDIKYC